MKLALVPKFHGTNCDAETLAWLADNLEVEARYLDPGADAGLPADRVACVVVPGGFSYGDYLRAGAFAARGPAMKAAARLASEGVPVLGVCNGFQILCEAGLLPGVLLKNVNRQHNHFPVRVRTDFAALREAEAKGGPGAAATPWLPRLSGRYAAAFESLYADVSIPLSCGMGRYVPPRAYQEEGGRLSLRHAEAFRVVFRYVHNENGAFDSIAGISTPDGRVLGLMPHPERASDPLVGGTQGLAFLLGLAENTGLAMRRGSALDAFATASLYAASVTRENR